MQGIPARRLDMFRKPAMYILSFSLLALFTVSLTADEGMWPLYDLDKLPFKELKSRGLLLDREDIYNPKGGGLYQAVVRLPGGSSSFVSPDGLIITNHHVAFSAIQRQATVDQNYVEQGFYASTYTDELPAPGYTALVSLSVEDVTDRILASVTEHMDPLDRFMAIDRVTKEVVKEAEEGRDVKCEVSRMFDGKQFILYTYFEIRDVRIVYAPPEAIGNYGDDIDNWRWPRHGGDFSFLRAYIAPDGSSAEYSKENVPFQSKTFLHLSAAGVNEDDITLVLGFPGRTQRYASSYHIDDLENYFYPRLIEMFEDYMKIIHEHSARDSSVALRHEEREAMIDNFLLYAKGLMEGFEKSDILETKREQERQIVKFLEENAELNEKYGKALPGLKKLFEEKQKTIKKDFVLGMITQVSDLFNAAVEIHKWAVEREKDDMERERGYQDRDTTRTIDNLKTMQINLVIETDKEIMKYFLKRGLGLPDDQKIVALEKIFEGKEGKQRDTFLDAYADEIYAKTGLKDEKTRLEMFRMSLTDLEGLGDPFITLAAALKPELDERRTRQKTRSGALSELSPLLIPAYAEWKQGNIYPDATFSMRLNLGEVKGYSPRDAVDYNYITSLKGLMEKETGEFPFIVPDELKSVYENRDYGIYEDRLLGDIPVDFLTTNDGTGGNSGSPIINGKGEIIGLDFDTNYESIAKDYLYHPDLARAVVCDIRYVLFIIDKVYHLDGLVKELTIN